MSISNDRPGSQQTAFGDPRPTTIVSGTDVMNRPSDPAPDRAWDHTAADRSDGRPRVAGIPLRDRVRWGAVWAGLLVAVGSYLVIQLALVATGAIDLSDASAGDAWWSAAAALVAFFIGGLTTGACAMWDNATDGVLHGVVLWAVGVVALLVLSVSSSGLALGALDATGVFDDVSADLEDAIDDAEAQDVGDNAEEAASWVLLGLGAAIVAAVAGGSVGASMWPRRNGNDGRTH
jgi:hypothetical protein